MPEAELPDDLGELHDHTGAPNGERIPTPCDQVQALIRKRIASAPEEKPDLEKLRAVFDSSIATWEKAGLFTSEREARGYVKPDFERDYAPLLTEERLSLMVRGASLNRGYTTPVWAPMDVPLENKNPENLSYLKLLKQALLRAYESTAGGKAQNTLLVGTEKRVHNSEKIDVDAIMWRWEHYLHPDVVHDVRTLASNTVLHGSMIHDGVSEDKFLEELTGVEKQTGGILRVERGQLVMSTDVGEGEKGMSAQDWLEYFNSGASLQNVKQALAYTIHCLETEGWIPDFDDSDHPETSRVALAPMTFLPDAYGGGQAPVLRWDESGKRYGVGGVNVTGKHRTHGVRIGMEIN